MKVVPYKIQDKVGVHARPANKLVQALNTYKSKVTVKFGDKQANAKSIINLMSLGLKNGSDVEFIIEGEDEGKLSHDLPDILNRENI